MANEAVFNLKIVADAAQAVSAMQSVSAASQKLQQGFGALQAAVGALAGFIALGSFKEMAKEARDAEKAQSRLESALRSTGQATKEYIKFLDDLAQKEKERTLVDDDVIKGIMEKLVTYGVEREAIAQLTALTLDYAKAMDIDPTSAAQIIGRALQGEATNLRGFNLEIDKTLSKKDQIGQLIERLQGRVGGRGASSSPFKRYELELGDLRKELGKVYNEFEKPLTVGLADGMKKARESVQKFLMDYPEISQLLRDLGKSFGSLASSGLPYIAFLTAAAAALVTFRGALLLGGPAMGFLIAAVAGFTLGTFIGELDLGSAKVKDWAERIALGLLGGVSAFKSGALALGAELQASLERMLVGAETLVAKFLQLIAKALKAANLSNAALGVSYLAGDLGKDSDKKLADIEKRRSEAREKIKAEFEEDMKPLREANAELDREIKGRKKFSPKEDEENPGKKPPPFEKKKEKGKGDGEDMKEVKLLTEQVTVAQQLYQAELQQSLLLEQQGTITSAEARQRSAAFAETYLKKLKELEAALIAQIKIEEERGNERGVQKLAVQWADVRNRILEANAAIKGATFLGQLQNQVNALRKSWGDWQTNAANFTGGAMTTGVNALSEALTGAIFKTRTWGEVFMTAAQQIIGQLIQIAVQLLAIKLISAIGGGIFSLFTGGATSIFMAEGGLVRAAEGTYINRGTGPKADDVHAMVSKGEYINDAATVAFHGPEFFAGLKSMAKRGFRYGSPRVPAQTFASGGGVSTRSSGGPATSNGSGPDIIVYSREEAVRLVSEDPRFKNARIREVRTELQMRGVGK